MKKFAERFLFAPLAVSSLVFSHAGFLMSHTFMPVIAPSAPLKNYIVVLKDGAATQGFAPDAVAHTYGLNATRVFSSALRGFSLPLTDANLAKLKADPRVRFVSEDRPISIAGTMSPNTKLASGQGFSATPLPQVVPTGVRRIHAKPGRDLFSFQRNDAPVVAVIDTGIDLTHPDLRDNIIANASCVDGVSTGNDDMGHGSHVAGTIAARNNGIGVVGVDPEAKLVAVKVLNSSGSGSWSTVICGVDWVTAHAKQYHIKLVNMSLGGYGASDNNCGLTNQDALHLAICSSTAAGVTYIVAAGNSYTDASTFVPAAYNDTLITVSALADSDGAAGGHGASTTYGADDTFAAFSNYSPTIVDIGGPGVDIYSTFKNGLYHVYSGTSMATPHVVGAAARYLESHPSAKTWQQILMGLRAAAEPLGQGHTDPSGNHPEPVVQASF